MSRRFWSIALVGLACSWTLGPIALAPRAGIESKPDGLIQEAGPMIEPNGLAQRAGPAIEPNGLTQRAMSRSGPVVR